MTEQEIGMLIVTLGAFLVAVHLFGFLFERLRQPRLIGEICAGILLGPFVLGELSPATFEFLFKNPTITEDKTNLVLGFVYWLGLLLLMFISGSSVRRLLSRENRRATAWILSVGTPLPFILVLGLGLMEVIPLEPLVGTQGVGISALLVLAIAVAVTSIPVISRIFHELGILETRFASLVLGSAVIQDIGLWGVLAIATALAQQSSLSDQGFIGSTTIHLAITMTYMAVSIIVMPRVLKQIRGWRLNLIYQTSPLAYAVLVLFVYIGVASQLDVNLVFAAFLSGFGLAGGIAGTQRIHFTDALDTISKFTFAVFTPVYFALVGYRLVFGREFSLTMLLIFLIGSSMLSLLSVGLAAKLAGFKRLDIINLAVTTNARGGPGIVLASVAYDVGIISAPFYTTLVLTAIFTSQAAGYWLQYVLNKGWPLLSSDPDDLGEGRARISNTDH